MDCLVAVTQNLKPSNCNEHNLIHRVSEHALLQQIKHPIET